MYVLYSIDSLCISVDWDATVVYVCVCSRRIDPHRVFWLSVRITNVHHIASVRTFLCSAACSRPNLILGTNRTPQQHLLHKDQ